MNESKSDVDVDILIESVQKEQEEYHQKRHNSRGDSEERQQSLVFQRKPPLQSLLLQVDGSATSSLSVPESSPPPRRLVGQDIDLISLLDEIQDEQQQQKLHQQLSHFLPERIKDTLFRTRNTKTKSPSFHRYTSVVLYVDVSGFSAVVDSLIRSSGSHAHLATIINEYLGSLIGIVCDTWKGDVQKISGNSVLVVWAPSESAESLLSCCLKAAACSFDLKQKLGTYSVPNTYDASGALLKLSLHSAITVGNTTEMHIGGYNSRWDFLISGEAVSSAARMMHLGRKGEILMSATMWSIVSSYCEGKALNPNTVLLTYISDENMVKIAKLPIPRLLAPSPVPVLESLTPAASTPMTLSRRSTNNSISTVSTNTSNNNNNTGTATNKCRFYSPINASSSSFVNIFDSLSVGVGVLDTTNMSTTPDNQEDFGDETAEVATSTEVPSLSYQDYLNPTGNSNDAASCIPAAHRNNFGAAMASYLTAPVIASFYSYAKQHTSPQTVDDAQSDTSLLQPSPTPHFLSSPASTSGPSGCSIMPGESLKISVVAIKYDVESYMWDDPIMIANNIHNNNNNNNISPEHRLFERIHLSYTLTQECLYALEGVDNKLLCDDKSSVMICAFGLPPYIHEDDALRSVKFALDLKSRLDAAGIECKIGIARGNVYAGPFGSPTRHEFTLLGEVVDLATRLMAHEVNRDILCDEASFKLSKQFVQFEALPPIKISKGSKTESIKFSAFRPLATFLNGDTSPASAALVGGLTATDFGRNYHKQHFTVGREDEIAFLVAKLSEFVKGKSSDPIFIEGEIGVGKSHLLKSVFVFHEGGSPPPTAVPEWSIRGGANIRAGSGTSLIGEAVYQMEGVQIELHTPFFALRELFQDLLLQLLNNSNIDITGESHRLILHGIERRSSLTKTPTEDLLRLLESIEPGLSAYYPLFQGVLQLPTGQQAPFKDNDTTSKLEGQLRFEITVEKLMKVLQYCWKEPAKVVLILDNAQWIDSSTMHLVHQIYSEMKNVLIIISQLPTMHKLAGPRQWNKIKERCQRTSRVIKLRRFSKAETAQLISRALDVDSLPPELEEMVFRTTGGHPSFAMRIPDRIKDQLVIRGGKFYSKEDPTGPELITFKYIILPESLPAMILSTVNRLPPSLQLVLQIASVLGISFALEVLSGVWVPSGGIALELARIPAFMKFLTQRGVLQELKRDKEYAFSCRSMQEVIYSDFIPPKTRKQLHLRIAEYIELKKRDNIEDYYGCIAHHYENAECWEKARYYCAIAGEAAFKKNAIEECIHLVTRAKKANEKCKEPVETLTLAYWEEMIGTCWLHEASDSQMAEKHIKQCLRILGVQLPRDRISTIIGIFKGLMVQLAHRTHESKYLKSQPPTAESAARARAIQLLVHDCYLRQDMLEWLWGIITGLNYCDLTGEHTEQYQHFQTSFAFFLGMSKMRKWARKYFERVLYGDSPLTSHVDLGFVYGLILGEPHVSIPGLQQGMEYNWRIRHWRHYIYVTGILIYEYHAVGNFDKAEQTCEQLREVARKKNFYMVHNHMLSYSAYLMMQEGRLNDALMFYQEVVSKDIYTKNQEELRGNASWANALICSAFVQSGRYQVALRMLDSVIAFLSEEMRFNIRTVITLDRTAVALLGCYEYVFGEIADADNNNNGNGNGNGNSGSSSGDGDCVFYLDVSSPRKAESSSSAPSMKPAAVQAHHAEHKKQIQQQYVKRVKQLFKVYEVAASVYTAAEPSYLLNLANWSLLRATGGTRPKSNKSKPRRANKKLLETAIATFKKAEESARIHGARYHEAKVLVQLGKYATTPAKLVKAASAYRNAASKARLSTMASSSNSGNSGNHHDSIIFRGLSGLFRQLSIRSKSGSQQSVNNNNSSSSSSNSRSNSKKKRNNGGGGWFQREQRQKEQENANRRLRIEYLCHAIELFESIGERWTAIELEDARHELQKLLRSTFPASVNHFLAEPD